LTRLLFELDGMMLLSSCSGSQEQYLTRIDLRRSCEIGTDRKLAVIRRLEQTRREKALKEGTPGIRRGSHASCSLHHMQHIPMLDAESETINQEHEMQVKPNEKITKRKITRQQMLM
jgi:hypothetical protein